ncbi:MAG: YdjY domain-containing protein [Dehalococcoidales bacterium]|jgi:hypothetical protein
MKLVHSKWLLTAALALTLAVTVLPACAKNTTVTVVSSGAVQPTEANPIVFDPANQELRLAAKVNGVAFTQPTWHAVVYTGGGAAGAALFQAFATPDMFYSFLTYFGGVPGNNMPAPSANYADTYVQGSNISITVTWAGAPKTYNLNDVVKNPGTKAIQMKFGGNLAVNQSAGTGCLACFYSCPIGIVSNASYEGTDNAAQAKAGQGGFLGDNTILPPDGTIVVLTFKVTP